MANGENFEKLKAIAEFDLLDYYCESLLELETPEHIRQMPDDKFYKKFAEIPWKRLIL